MADLGDFADALDLLEVVLKIARQQFESAITVTRRGRGANLRQRILVSHQQYRTGEIRVVQFTVCAHDRSGEIGDKALEVGPAG